MYNHYKYNDKLPSFMHSKDAFNSVVTTAVPVGLAFGAFFGGKIASIGRRKTVIMLSSIFVLGSMLTLIFNFYFLALGRLVVGFAGGAISIAVPMFLSETSPISISGAIGSLNQIMITVGIMVAAMLGFSIPLEDDEDEQKDSNIWILVFLIPGALAVLQIIMLALFYKYDTPAFYWANNQVALAKEVESKIYHEQEINRGRANSEHSEEESTSSVTETYTDLLTAPYIASFLIGCGLSIVQQLSGINCIIFYSTDIFTSGTSGSSEERAAQFGTFLVGLINCLSSLLALPLLSYYGRRSLMMVGQIGMFG